MNNSHAVPQSLQGVPPLRIVTAAVMLLAFAALPDSAQARVRLEHICTIQGQQEVRLTGMGLVVGLPGTGDGAKNASTVRALAAAMTRLQHPITEQEIRNADNVAVVLVEATIPRTGLRRGQKIDGFVSAILGAKSLKGGRLLSTPLTTNVVGSNVAVALAGGAVHVEDAARPTGAKVVQSVDLQTDVTSLFVNQLKGDIITLMIDPTHASFWTASEVARVINTEFSFESGGKDLARAVSPAAVELNLLGEYRDRPVEFLAEVLEVGIDIPQTAARVVLNSRTGTVIVTGEVEISPVVINHKSFSIEVTGEPVAPTVGGPFVPVTEGDGRQSPQKLQQLVTALNQLRVPTTDIIEIIRELHVSGKLHAELVDR